MKTINRYRSKQKSLIYISKRLIVFFAFVIAGSWGCKKFVEVPAPVTQLVTKNVFQDNSSATAAQLYIYANMQSVPANLDAITALSSDELFNYAPDAISKAIYSNGLTSTTGGNVTGFWKTLYAYLYDENAILENLATSNGVSIQIKRQLSGEAEFMRAYFYFQLTNLYGDVPLAITTDYTINSNLPKTPSSTVYQQMIADLIDAETKLSSKYLDATDTVTTVERARPTYWSACALLARVYLYSGDQTRDLSKYKLAEDESTKVINNTSLFGLSPINGSSNVFQANSSEAIWQIIPPVTNAYAAEGQKFIPITRPPSANTGNATISNQLMAAFEAGDLRKIYWIGTYTDKTVTPNVNYYYPGKYKLTTTASTKPSLEYSMILRLGEQFLIRAEARAQQNNIAGSVSDLNMIRHRAGLPDYSGPNDKTSLLNAILHERQVELFTEGHRWFDLKRTGQIDAVMAVVTPQKVNAPWKSYQQQYPVDPTVILSSPNVVQNIGY